MTGLWRVWVLAGLAEVVRSQAGVSMRVELDYGDSGGSWARACVDEERGCAHFGSPLCLDNVAAYQGRRASTRTGRRCQRWDRQAPHKHRYAATGRHNFCRVTTNETAPYCFTTDGAMVWEYCFPDCSDICADRWPPAQCARFKGFGYCTSPENSYFMRHNCALTCGVCRPTQATAVDEAVVFVSEVQLASPPQRMAQVQPLSPPVLGSATSGNSRRGERAVSREGAGSVARASGACVDEVRGCAYHGSAACRRVEAYGGGRSTTATGIPCQRWDAQAPHRHNQSWVGAHSLCRNPDGEMSPWCWTVEPGVPWEYCFPLAPCVDDACRDRWDAALCRRYRGWGYCRSSSKYRYWMTINCCQQCRLP